MIKHLQQHKLLVYFLIFIMFMDTIFRHATFRQFIIEDFIVSTIFLVVVTIALYIIVSLFHGKTAFVISIVLLAGVAIIYSTQLIYYQFFKTFYSFYSIGQSTQVIQFWKDIISYILNHIWWLSLIWLPIIIFAIFGHSYFPFSKHRWLTQGVLIGLLLMFHLGGISTIHLHGKEQHSPYDLYYQTNLPIMSTQRLGLLTTMRLDLQRLATGWTPTFDQSLLTENTDRDISQSNPLLTEQDIETSTTEDHYDHDDQILDIDFAQMIENETNSDLKDMHQYFSNIEPTTTNEYTGIFEGYNVILLTAEAFSPFAVDKDMTPTLYQLVHEGYYFSNFYTPIWEVSTSDGEYVALNSLLPKSGVWSFRNSGNNALPFVLGNQLNERGYTTKAYHNHTYTYYDRHISHPNMGYDYKGLGNGLNVEETWPESDLEMMEKTVHEYIEHEPFHAYYMTVSGHMQYSFEGNYIAWKNKKFVDHLPYSNQAKAYLATQIELDRALQYLLEQLEEKGIAEHTLIALSSDHYPYGLDKQTIDEFAGHTVDENFELYENHFILYTKGMEREVIDKPSSSLDILPTLSNLLGLPYDSRLLMGRDIFSDAPPLIPFLNKSFITDKGRYNSITQQFIPNENEDIDEDYVDFMKALVEAKFYYSAKILDTDYYRKLFDDE